MLNRRAAIRYALASIPAGAAATYLAAGSLGPGVNTRAAVAAGSSLGLGVLAGAALGRGPRYRKAPWPVMPVIVAAVAYALVLAVGILP